MIRYPGSANAVLSGLLACLLLLAGCKTLTPISNTHFVDFRTSIAQLKTSSDQALKVEQDLVYERTVRQWKNVGKVDQLQLLPGQQPFTMNLANNVLYQDIQTARNNLGQINALVLQYADALLLLAGGQDGSPDIDPDSLGKDLQTSANALASTLNLQTDISDGYFFGFGALAKAYLEGKRSGAMIDLINSSQLEIEEFSTLGQNISLLSGSGIRAEYTTAYSQLAQGFTALSSAERDSHITEILALNNQTLKQLHTLELIRDGYKALPNAHRSLAQAANGGGPLSFPELLTAVESLKRRYQEFTEE